MLLSRDECIQLSGAQCVAEVLNHHLDYGKMLLKADIAGIVVSDLEVCYIISYILTGYVTVCHVYIQVATSAA